MSRPATSRSSKPGGRGRAGALFSLASCAGYSPGQNILLLIGLKFFALNIIVIRGLFEISQSRGATVAVIVAWMAYTTALVAQYPAEPSSLTQHRDLILGNSMLIGTTACFAMSLIFARYVYLHANELIEAKPGSQRSESGPVSKTESSAGENSSAIKETTRTTRKKSAARQKKSSKPEVGILKVPRESLDDTASENTADSERPDAITASDEAELETLALKDSEELSKSQRRRLRKLQKRQRRAA